MKILLVNNLYDPFMMGGAERSVRVLAEALLRDGDEPVVVTLAPKSEPLSADVDGVRVHYVRLRNVYWPFRKEASPQRLKPVWHLVDSWNPRMRRALAEVLERESPDVVHTNNLAGFSVAAWAEVKKRRIPLLHTLRDYYVLCPRSTMFRNGANCSAPCLACRPYSALRRRVCKLVDGVVANSRFLLLRHQQHGCFRETPVQRVVYNSWTAARGEMRAGAAAESRLRLGYLGRLHPTKGVELLLETAADGSAYEVRLAGTGEPAYERSLRARWTQPHVQFMGFCPAEELFAQIDVLVVPSLWHEPLPRVIGEAYARGIPVLGSNRGGIPEVIEEGRTGFVFDPDARGSLGAALRRFQNNEEREAMRSFVLTKALEFAPERVAQAYREAYASVRERRQ